MAETKKKKVGRPKKSEVAKEEIVNETPQRLEMSERQEEYTVESVGKQWAQVFNNLFNRYESDDSRDGKNSISKTMAQWNKLNPFLQNQRIKNLYTQAATYNKQDIGRFLQSPGENEQALRGIAWSNSSSQSIYYNILRRSCDIPQYKYFVVPEYSEDEKFYSIDSFKQEDALVHSWLEMFNIPNTFKTMALQIKREGKQSYLLRNSFEGEGKQKKPCYCALQKMPSDWIKITGIGQLGYTISFNMLYFLNIANYPSFFGDFIENAWKDMMTQGIIKTSKNDMGNIIKYDFCPEKAMGYSFNYQGTTYSSTFESNKKGRAQEYLFWLRMPYDICYTFGSDNSTPWAAPDTMGLLQKLQELSDYGTLAGLIASTPLTAVLTGEIETVNDPKPGKNESVYSPEVIKGMQDLFNAVTSTNVEAWMWPAKNIKLQQLNADVNSSDIVTKATQNFVVSAGDSGLTITTDKPNVSQIKTAQLLAASQQRYVTLQFEQVMNFILKYKLGFKYEWKIKIWGDIFSFESEKKYLKELVAGGAMFLLPKLASAEDISLRDVKAMTSYIKTLDFYKNFATLTMERNIELKGKGNESNGEEDDNTKSKGQVGRPALDESEIENDATAASRQDGTNTVENRDTMSKKCPICGAELEEGQIVCEECAELIKEQE
nr:MAG TPA: portal protein [Caudoviricetes sp.]